MVGVLVLAVLALVGALFPSFSPAAAGYVLAVGGALACLGLSGRLARRPVAVPRPATAVLVAPDPVVTAAPDPAMTAPAPAVSPLPPAAAPMGAGPGGAEPGGAEPGGAGPGGAEPGGPAPVGAEPGGVRATPAGRLSPAAAWWLVPALLLGTVELADLALGSTYPHPTLSVLLDPVLEHYPARAAAYFGWLAAFWALVRR